MQQQPNSQTPDNQPTQSMIHIKCNRTQYGRYRWWTPGHQTDTRLKQFADSVMPMLFIYVVQVICHCRSWTACLVPLRRRDSQSCRHECMKYVCKSCQLCYRSLVKLVGLSILDNGIDGPNGSQKHDGHKHNNVDHICPKINAVLLWLHDYQPDDTWHPEGHGSKPKGAKESKQVCTKQSVRDLAQALKEVALCGPDRWYAGRTQERSVDGLSAWQNPTMIQSGNIATLLIVSLWDSVKNSSCHWKVLYRAVGRWFTLTWRPQLLENVKLMHDNNNTCRSILH